MRELDWRIHEYMGNDLTGFTWPKNGPHDSAVRVTDKKVICQSIPHYSSTWEGAGLVMEWLMKQGIRHTVETYGENSKYVVRILIGDISSMFCRIYVDVDNSAPLALAKAYISAMEERDNG